MNYDELYSQAMNGDTVALKELKYDAGRGVAQAQFVLSCVYNNAKSPFRNVELAMYWLKTSAGYDYEPAVQKVKELPIEIKKQYDIETESGNVEANAKKSNVMSDSILSYEGRIDRTTYFIYIIIYAFAFGIILAVIKTITSDSEDTFWTMLGITIQIIRLYLIGAISVKRLHDCGRSGWWSIFIPITQIVIQFLPGDEKDNEYGPKID